MTSTLPGKIALTTSISENNRLKIGRLSSGGSEQFGIRAPCMAEHKFLPLHGSVSGMVHHLELADEVGVDAPLVDYLLDVFRRALPIVGERDIAAVIEVFERNTGRDGR
jgi:hypothetical protein